MGLIVRLCMVFIFVASPLYLLNALVMPGLRDLAAGYSSFDQTAAGIVDEAGEPVSARR